MFLLPQYFSPSQCTIFYDVESGTKINHLKYDKYKEYAKMKSCSKVIYMTNSTFYISLKPNCSI